MTWLHVLLSVGLCSSLLIVIFLLQLPMGVAVLAMLLLFFICHKWNVLLPLFIIRHSTRGLRTNSVYHLRTALLIGLLGLCSAVRYAYHSHHTLPYLALMAGAVCILVVVYALFYGVDLLRR